ncbi:uncharacterized protein LOC142764973 [Rhipicephalus microplus]|uniref:uncharacterized protein LOC142764973 n=1 Tax=Rhipicephalus microplus TaxID=6941 RepID=UPI003F6C71F0
MAAVESLLDRSVRAVRTRTLPSRVSSLQELCRRRLVATRSLSQWKALTQAFTERIRRRACLFSLVHFSGCGVNFCMQRYFSESDHTTYWISCELDRKRYMAVRAPNYSAERLLGDDNLWHWALLDHPHVLSVLAVAANAPGIQVYLITLAPDDGLEHFAGVLAARDLCVPELHLWKFLRQLCSALIYLRGQGLTVEPFDFFNVYLRHADLVLNNGLVWNQRRFEITSLPGSLWSHLLRPDDDFAAVYAAISTTEHEATAFSVAVVVAQLVALAYSDDPADTISRRRPSASGCLQAVHRLYGIELVLSPCSYGQQLVSTLAEMFRTPQPNLDAIHDRADRMYASRTRLVAHC